MPRTYKIRKFENGKNKAGDKFINYSLTLPTPTAEKVIGQFGDGLEFEIELTKEGILYRPVVVEQAPDEIPFEPQTRTKAAAAPAKPKPARTGAKPKAATSAKPKPSAKPKATAAKAKPAAAPKAAPKARPSAAKKGAGSKPAAPRAPRARPRAKAAA